MEYQVGEGRKEISRWDYTPSSIHMKKLPVEPVRRYYPEVEKRRPVIVEIMKFSGPREHYWVTIEEEYNYFYDEKGERWCQPWIHKSPVWHRGRLINHHAEAAGKDEGVGRVFEDKFNTEDEARDFVERIVDGHFPEKTHVVLWDCRGIGQGKPCPDKIKREFDSGTD